MRLRLLHCVRTAIARIADISCSSACSTPWTFQASSGESSMKRTRKRNLGEYEGDLDVDEPLIEALIRVTTAAAERVQSPT